MEFFNAAMPLPRKALLIIFLLLFDLSGVHGSSNRKRRKPLEGYSQLVPKTASDTNRRMRIENMTCGYFEQPLNHFELPRRPKATYLQRYCMYDGHVSNMKNATILFYTGNESPLEQYINNTGLMWEMAEALNAQVVFVEHRYEGKSHPLPNIPNCMAYSSSVQALADFANFIERHLFATESNNKSLQRRPVIAYGGSYGGMLSAWMRMKYPNIIAGAVAASAPIFGFPRNFPDKIDSAWRIVQHGLNQPYPPSNPPTDEPKHDNYCSRNLLAAWPLIDMLSGITEGRELLSTSFRLCDPLTSIKDGRELIDWAQSPWFDLAEGSFPYPSSYIPFALTHNDQAKLPAWPLQAACWTHSDLHADFGISFHGNLSDVRYEIRYGQEGGTIVVDWDVAMVSDGDLRGFVASNVVADLLTSVRDAVSVWFNVTKDVRCYNLTAAPSKSSTVKKEFFAKTERRLSSYEKNATSICEEKMKEGSWPSLCCNEEMNLIITEASGLGNDFLWPPSHPRGTASYQDIIPEYNSTDTFCDDPGGIYGYPTYPPDPWATWYDIYYGGTAIDSHSNIIFSNGLLDPWSAAGVYAPTSKNLSSSPGIVVGEEVVPGLYIQNISRSMIALIMEYGGHHTDLMYSSKEDPPSIREARKIEDQLVRKWISEWWSQGCVND